MNAIILATWLAVPLAVGFGVWLSWRKVKKQQRLWRGGALGPSQGGRCRVARIEELLKLKGRPTPLHFVTYDAQVVRLLLAATSSTAC